MERVTDSATPYQCSACGDDSFETKVACQEKQKIMDDYDLFSLSR